MGGRVYVYRVQGGCGLRDVLVPQPHGEVDGGEAEPDAHGGLRRAARLHHLEDLGGRLFLALAWLGERRDLLGRVRVRVR